MPDSTTADARALWESKAAFWDEQFGEGNRFHREMIEPSALQLLDVQPGMTIFEIACGNGAFSRKLASLGAQVVATDFSEVFIDRARARTVDRTDRIQYSVLDATDRDALLTLGERRFDAAVANMALMDIVDIEPLATTLPRLLTPGAHFVFTVQHPCFNSNGISFLAEAIMDEDGRERTIRAIKTWAYLDLPAGQGGGMPGEPNPHMYFHRPLHQLFGAFFRQGFVLDGLLEPTLAPGTAELGWGAVGGQIPPVLAARMRLR